MLSLEPNVVSRHTFVVYSYTVKWIQSIHVQALRRSMSIRGSPERLKTGNRGVCAQRVVRRAKGCAQRVVRGSGVRNALCAGGGDLCLAGGVCARACAEGGGRAQWLGSGGGMVCAGGCAQRVVRGGARPVPGRWHVHKAGLVCAQRRARRGGAQRVVRGGGGGAQRVARGGEVCATGCARGACAQRVGGAAPVPGRWHVHKGLCGVCVRATACAREGGGVCALCAGGGRGVRNGLCARGGAQQLVPGKGRVPQKKSHMSSSFRSPRPPTSSRVHSHLCSIAFIYFLYTGTSSLFSRPKRASATSRMEQTLRGL